VRREQIYGQNVGCIFTNEYSRIGFLTWERNKEYYHKPLKEGNGQFDLPEGQTSADLYYKLVEDSSACRLSAGATATRRSLKPF